MHITRFTDLSLRVLMYLCARPSQDRTTVTEIAERIGWTRNHVVKVVHRLSQEGWLATQRGRTGGLGLDPQARKLRLGNVIRTLEGDDCLINCKDPPCNFGRGCPLIKVLNDAQNVFYEALNAYTLEDVAQHSVLAHLFALSSTGKVVPIIPAGVLPNKDQSRTSEDAGLLKLGNEGGI